MLGELTEKLGDIGNRRTSPGFYSERRVSRGSQPWSAIVRVSQEREWTRRLMILRDDRGKQEDVLPD